MARKKTARKPVTRGRKSSSELQREQQQLVRYITIALIVGFVLLFGVFLVTGNDPLGLFTEEPTPTSSVGQGEPGSGGDWWQVYFTDPLTINDPANLAGSIPEKLIRHIDDAQRSIHIAAFEFDLAPIADALIAARQRGVEVQWVTDDEHGIEADEDAGLELFATLEDAGIDVKDDGRGALMHNKFWIFDGQTVWTGSTNITANGNFRNNNNVIVLDAPQVAVIFEREFAEMWDGEFGPRSPSTVDDQQVMVDGTPVQILFAAEDEVAKHLLPLIEGARTRIRFMAFSFTHDTLGAAVLARAEAGVDVQGIFETRGSETEYSEMPRLFCAGVPVRQDGNPGTFHHKVFVIDDRLVVTGSYNFSESADDSNDENVVIVTNADIAAPYLEEFERRWAEAQAPDAAEMNCR
jgi:phosphatidylserine/phosphatidylglycerophosphate/cardiolipin synthase-like enzyme